jgi:hypothetical protein
MGAVGAPPPWGGAPPPDGKPVGTCAQICAKIRPTITAAIAQPAPTKKPTQNQTPIWWRLMVEGMSDSLCGDDQ